jgi:hypothetical protein
MGMSKKPRKIEETTAPYVVKKMTANAASPKSAVSKGKNSDDATFNKVTGKIFLERKELLHKLAQ